MTEDKLVQHQIGTRVQEDEMEKFNFSKYFGENIFFGGWAGYKLTEMKS